jgi:calcineurin-like phosphoesterase family protein
MYLLNDLHLGVVRAAGTTPTSREALRSYIFNYFRNLLNECGGDDLCILGDLFDSFEVAPRDWLETFNALCEWCEANFDHNLILVAGNHDVSMKGNKVSSFETLASVLSKMFTNVVMVGIDEVYNFGNLYMVAHHRNQDTFDLALKAALDEVGPNCYVLLHANYHNKFSEAADHSLNVSEDVAKEFCNKGVTLVFAHEHQSRSEIPHGTRKGGGTVAVLGNQFPTSISDCLGNQQKYYWRIGDGGLEKFRSWTFGGNAYLEVDWRSLEGTQADFVRVVGDATNAEAANVIDALHRFRQKSDAFVVGNAVKIEGIADIGDLPETFEVAKKFDVMEFIYSRLDDKESQAVKKIVENIQ